MFATGADAQGVEGALNKVRDVSWAAGRTFRGKHVVLLAFAEVSGPFCIVLCAAAYVALPPDQSLPRQLERESVLYTSWGITEVARPAEKTVKIA